MTTLADLAGAGWITEDWSIWQQGRCGTFAIALMLTYPQLRLGVCGTTENGGGDASDGWTADHFFAHDDTHAYDSAGKHPLPYLGINGTLDYAELDTVAAWWGIPDDEAGPEGSEYWLDLAADHIRKHGIGPA